MRCELKIDWATHEAAKFACLNWHYSKCLPVGKLVKVGAWENKKFVGVVLFGRGANLNIGSPYNLKQDECVELVRIALSKHETPVSRIMAIALKFLKKSNPKIKLVVSYADLDAGHHGGIYQATNWIYVGQSNTGNRQGFLIKGKLRHNKSVHSMGCKQSLADVRKNIDPNAKEIFTKGKHKYLMPLDKQTQLFCAKLSKPFPKRVVSAAGGIPGDQSGGGGSIPTTTLQSSQPQTPTP